MSNGSIVRVDLKERLDLVFPARPVPSFLMMTMTRSAVGVNFVESSVVFCGALKNQTQLIELHEIDGLVVCRKAASTAFTIFIRFKQSQNYHTHVEPHCTIRAHNERNSAVFLVLRLYQTVSDANLLSNKQAA